MSTSVLICATVFLENPPSILCYVGRDVQLYRCTVVHTLLEQQRNLKGKVACLEDTNLENFFTEYLIFMHGTIFLGVWCDSQVWNTLIRKYGTYSPNHFICREMFWSFSPTNLGQI